MTRAYQTHIAKFLKYILLDHRLWITSGLKLFRLLTSINRTISTTTISLLIMTICSQKPITQLKFTTTYMGNTMLYHQTDSDPDQNIIITLAIPTVNWPLIISRSDIVINGLDFRNHFKKSQKPEILLGFPEGLGIPRTLQNTSIFLFPSQRISTSQLSLKVPAFAHVTKVKI